MTRQYDETIGPCGACSVDASSPSFQQRQQQQYQDIHLQISQQLTTQRCSAACTLG